MRAAVLFTIALCGFANVLHAASDVTVKGGQPKGGKFKGSNPRVFTPSKANASAGRGLIQGTLNGGRGVTIKTQSAAGAPGDLTIAAALAKTKGKSAPLRFEAVRDIAVNGAISTTKTLPLIFSAGRAISSTAAISSNGADITIDVAESFVVGEALSAGAGRVVLQSGRVDSTTAQTVTASSVEISQGAAWRLRGSVAGDLSVAGVVGPGVQGIESLQVSGALSLQPTATTVINLGGSSQANYGRIGVTGAAVLDGTLQIDFVNGFEDAINSGNTFTILSAGSISGRFAGLENDSRLILPDDLGSVKITYTATTVTLSDWQPIIIDLTWDPGESDAGTQVFTSNRPRGRRHYFRMHSENTDIGAWRTRLTTTTAEADLYMSLGGLPSTIASRYRSKRVGADGFVLNQTEFAAGQEWFLLVDADPGTVWTLVSGRAFVQDLGSLGWTDANASGTYDIGEAVIPSGSGLLTIGGEGMRFYKTVVPNGTPAWSLWLHGSTKEIAVRRGVVPFHSARAYYDRKQAGQMLVVPPSLGSGTATYFASVVGNPGESVGLDSRIQEVTDIAFDSSVTNVAVPDAPYRVYRVQVPVQQIAWDVSTVAISGDPNVAVRRDTVPAELDNDAFSEVPGTASDSITLVPNYLTDGTWYITVYGSSPYSFTLRNGPPEITPLPFAGSVVNDRPARTGWRFYALTDIPAQLGAVGWELRLSNHVAGTEIGVRRNAVPSRWRSREDGSSTIIKDAAVEFSGLGGFLQRQGHQADIWYVGIYLPTEALGAFTLTCFPIEPPTIAFDGGTQSGTDLEPGRWEFVRVDVPPGATGWDVRARDTNGAVPVMIVRRDLLPIDTPQTWSASTAASWPSGNQWHAGNDWTGYTLNPGSISVPPRLVAGMTRPLQAGTYYVGVLNNGSAEIGYTIDSRGIGGARTYPVPDLAYAGGSATITDLAPREARYFKVTIAPNTQSWEVAVAATAGDIELLARRGAVPDFSAHASGSVYSSDGQVEMQKVGAERYVLLPPLGAAFIPPDDYYLAVVSEGTGAVGSIIGNVTSSAVVTSLGPLAITDLGTATAQGRSEAVTLEAGQIKAFQFTVPQNTYSLEVRLENRLGAPSMSVISGALLPTPAGTYGNDGGNGGFPTSAGPADAIILTAANPSSGVWSVNVNAGTTVGASATLIVKAIGIVPLPFDGGTVAVVDHQPATVRYFEVNVPSGVVGWDLRLRDVVGPHPPMVVRPDLLPGVPGTNWAPWTASTWTAGNWWQGGVDWTGYTTNPSGTAVPPRLVMGMGRPLRPGTFYVAVFNDSTTEAISYTVDSRGIGAGQTYPTPDLAYSGGAVDISDLAPREPKHFKVTIPPNTPSWEITLAPTAGEMEMLVRRDTVADFAVSMTGAIHEAGTGAEVEMQKVGPERYVLLPAGGQAFVPAADYYVSVISEGVSPASATIGTGASSGQLTSVGPLAITDLGTATPASSTHPVSLVSGQIKAYQFTVPAGTDSLEVRLENTTGFPAMSLGAGTMLPVPPGTSPLGSRPYSEYGFDGGNAVLQDTAILTVANPAPGIWHVLVRARHDGQSAFPPATADLIVTALRTVTLAFDGGSFSINNQPQNTWRYFAVDVPADAMGWDIRLRDVTGPLPAMMVRRDLLPIIPPNQSTPGHIPGGWIARASTAWAPGNQWLAGTDWTGYNLNAAGVPVPPRMVGGMGRPLEAGRYYIGLLNNTNAPTSYTIDSRGIGAGLTYTITELPFNGGIAPITELPRREAQYFKVSIPANTPSWEVTLGSTIGDLELLVRRTTIPDFGAAPGGSVYTGSEGLEVEMQKRGPERYVLLPSSGQDFVTAGDYYLAVVSEGANPTATTIGTGPSSGDLTSHGILQVANLGAATTAGLTESVALAGGQVKAYHFDVAAGTHSIELRLENMIGSLAMSLIPGARLPVPPGLSPIGTFPYSEYGHDGGTTGTQAVNIQNVPNPAPGVWSVLVRAGHDSQNTFPDGSANLTIRQKQNIPLNFAASQNASGGTNTDTRQAVDGEYNIYQVTVPALLDGQPVLGWIIQTEILQGAASFVAYKDFASPTSGITLPTGFAVIVPPYLAAGDVFYIRVKATGFTEYRITSRPVTLERPVWQMPVAHNLTFGDSGDDSSGAPLPGDRGVDLEQGFWHFYAIDVPAGNPALLRTELQAISGNPDLYIREDGVPTTYHLSGGATGSSLVHRTLTGATTSYGNWVPLDGKTQKNLRPGRWYLGVRASATSNVRYRLIASTGAVKDLALDPASALPQLPSSVTEHSIADNDWRYYRFTIPPNAPKNWILTFSQQVGDVVLWLRDTIPPGQKTANGSGSFDIASWSSDAKNQGPYIDGQDPVGAYTLITPPLRPGHTYYAGFRSKNSATFSVSSDTGAGLIGPLPSLDFYTGTITTNVPANASLLCEIPVPIEGTRLKWNSTNSASVSIRMEQGTLPTSSGSQHFTTSSANASFNQALSPTAWPWQPGQTYYVRFVNSTASPQPITFTMNGKNAENEDEDADGLLDAWERQYFNSLGYTSASDPDADGVTNAVEYVDGTNPSSASSAKYTLAVLAINGAANANPVQAKYDKGTVLTITNTADPGYSFVGWSGGPFRGDDFVMRATGTITFPADGTWTFGVNAADGGVLRVNGVTLFSDDTQHEARDRFAEITLPAGSYPLELIAFERTGSEAVELFAAPGSHTTFNAAFDLVGDVANGGLAISSISGGNAVPEFTIRQVEAASHQISSLVAANNLLAGTYAAARDVTALIDVVNFLTYDFSEGHFGGNAHLPLSAGIEDAPLSLTMNANYTITALHSLPLDAAADAPLVWVTGGNIPWLGANSASAFDGVDAVRSGPIGDGQNSAVRTTVTGPGTLTFQWKVSSQTGDNLAVQLDGVQQAVISGEVTWVQRVINITAGAHTVTWIYSKNSSGAAGGDTGWIDQVVFTPTP